ncbi:pentapeptide repeat-containing protein [Mycolicibacterium vanbaalenii]|uniref:pentapeptide repeat-containing protein n=1 Tax=Mycolicibacterium vanbaalenii TaxID=110539 RepID=UPI001F3D2832|nr:pentapeptide repeat-containing protein [Mycolicibacterium vanbaalenii]
MPCSTVGCAAQHVTNGWCVLHGGQDTWKAFLRRIQDGSKLDELRGCAIGADEFGQLLDNLQRRDGTLRINGADFTDSTFVSDVCFKGVTFGGETSFAGTTFEGSLRFEKVTLADVSFGGAHARGSVTFDDVEVTGDLRSDSEMRIGAMHANTLHCRNVSTFASIGSVGDVEIYDSTFDARFIAKIDSPNVKFANSRFDTGLTLTLTAGALILDHASFGEPSVITGFTNDSPAGIVSLTDVDVSKLTLRNVDLSRCHFGSAYGVDELIMDNVRWGHPRHWWQSDRAVLAEEKTTDVDPASVARIYRGLRKAVETSKDDAGAADFYYGEMLMRRRRRLRDIGKGNAASRLAALVDYTLLSVYWAISGFGLRVGRSLAAFAVLVGACTILLAAAGYPVAEPTFVPVGVTSDGLLVYSPEVLPSNKFGDNLGRAFRLAAQSSVSLLQTPAQSLTPAGDWIVLVLRFTGPIVLGLAILAVRNKLRR